MSNVQRGDLARIIGCPGNEMAIVEVLELSDSPNVRQPAWNCRALSAVVGPRRTALPGELVIASDRILRPLHGGDGVDEMLQRVGKPESAAIEWALGTERTA